MNARTIWLAAHKRLLEAMEAKTPWLELLRLSGLESEAWRMLSEETKANKEAENERAER